MRRGDRDGGWDRTGGAEDARDPPPARLRKAVGAPASSAARSGSPCAIAKTSPDRRLRRCLTRPKATPSKCGFRMRRVSARKGRLPASGRAGAQGPRAPKHGRCARACILGAVCPARATRTARVMPRANTDAMRAHRAGIGRHVLTGAHAILVVDGTGWHRARNLVVPAKPHTADAPASPPGAEPGRDHPAVPLPEPPRKPRLRQRRRHRRHLLQNLECAPRNPAPHRLRHFTRPGEGQQMMPMVSVVGSVTLRVAPGRRRSRSRCRGRSEMRCVRSAGYGCVRVRS
jgi:hypothetical protein